MTATELANYGGALPILSSPIAESGDKRDPIAGSNNETDTQASVKFGLPALMSEPLDQDGIPVPRQDLNGIYNLLSKMVHFLMAGGRIPYRASESTAIGGYPAGAEVSYHGHNYKSLVNSNTDFPTNTTKWARIDYLPLTGGTVSGTIQSIASTNGVPTLSGNDINIKSGEKTLHLTTGGVMQWDGKNIVRSVNGFNANPSGNVNVNTVDGKNIVRSVNGVDANSSGDVNVNTVDGKYIVRSVNGVDANSSGNVGIAGWPNYSSRSLISSGSTVSSNGWIQAMSGTDYAAVVIKIDNIEVVRTFSYDIDEDEKFSFLIPIAKGSKVTYSNASNVYFVPAKVS